MNKLAILLVACGAWAVQAQEAPEATATSPQVAEESDNTLTSYSGEFFRGDFFNAYAFVNGLYDSVQQTIQSANRGSSGVTLGGGISASKTLRSSLFSINYRGDYRRYSSSFGTGTNQNLALVYSKRLGARWTLSTTASAGDLFYSTGYFSSSAAGSGSVSTNPFSPSTRFLSAAAYLSYRQTARLTYTFGGSFFLARYSFPGAIGTTGGVGTASAMYKLTARTSVGGTYSHTKFVFQQNAGDSNLDGGFFNIEHIFGAGWNAHFAVGVTHVQTSGTSRIPVFIEINGQLIPAYIIEPYSTTRSIPTYEGGVKRHFRQFNFAANAGHGVTPGNGTVLTSSNTYFGGSLGKAIRDSSLGVNAFYSRITSVSNQLNQGYKRSNFTLFYSRLVYRHVSATANYTFFHYDSFGRFGATNDNRISFGVSVNSGNIPMTLF